MTVTDALTTTTASEDARGAVATMKTKNDMRAIIEIPDDLIREACMAVRIAKPHLAPIVMMAYEKLRGVDTMAVKFDEGKLKETIEADVAMLCITQVMEELIEGYERN